MYRNMNFRRQNEQKAKSKAQKYLKRVFNSIDFPGLVITPSRVGIMARTRCTCSCNMCCNPRHATWGNHEEHITMQERKAEEDFYQQLEE